MQPDSRASLSSEFGSQAEDFVADWLCKNGFKILQRNYRKFFGEIDLIASKKNLIVFVEVKARKSEYFNLSELITYSKQKKIINTARHYIAKHRITDSILRFDVALVLCLENKLELNYIENAFTQSSEF